MHSHIQEKTNRLHTYAKQVGLKINKRKTEVMTLNVQNPAPVKVEEDPLPYTDQFTYLGSTVNVRHDGGAGSDIINRIGKARNVFRMLSPVWKSQQYKTHTKLKLCPFDSTIRVGVLANDRKGHIKIIILSH